MVVLDLSEIYDDNLMKIVGIFFSTFSGSILVPAFIGVICCGKTTETILNKMVSSVSQYSIVWILFIDPFDCVRYMIGPFPDVICFLTNVFKNTIIVGIALLFR